VFVVGDKVLNGAPLQMGSVFGGPAVAWKAQDPGEVIALSPTVVAWTSPGMGLFQMDIGKLTPERLFSISAKEDTTTVSRAAGLFVWFQSNSRLAGAPFKLQRFDGALLPSESTALPLFNRVAANDAAAVYALVDGSPVGLLRADAATGTLRTIATFDVPSSVLTSSIRENEGWIYVCIDSGYLRIRTTDGVVEPLVGATRPSLCGGIGFDARYVYFAHAFGDSRSVVDVFLKSSWPSSVGSFSIDFPESMARSAVMAGGVAVDASCVYVVVERHDSDPAILFKTPIRP